MKTGHFFWGILFITFGGLYLISNFTPIKMDWEFIWSLWPLFLILLGTYFLIKQSKYRWILVILSGFVLGLVMFAAIKNISGFVDEDFDVNIDNGDYNVEHFYEHYSNKINNANLYVEAAAGKFFIKDTTSMLIDAVAKGSRNNDYYFKSDSSGGIYDLSLEMESDRHIKLGRYKNNVDIKLNPNARWDLRFDIGASSVDLDLSPYKVQMLDIKSGAAKVKVKIGSKTDYTKVNFDSGVSNLEILVPRTSGCQINTDTDLSSKNFRGFNKIDKNIYQTSNYNSAPNKAVIDLKTAVSSIRVAQY